MKNGIYTDLSIDDYHSNDTHISATQIKRAKKSLSEYWYYEWHPQEKKSHFDFGNAFEMALIEPKLFAENVIIFDAEKRPEKKKGITSEKNQSWKKEILNGDKSSIFWTDEETGLNLKTRPDISKKKKNVIVDIKTAIDGSPEGFSRALSNNDYPLQACIQIDGCQSSGLIPVVDTYFWLVVEKVPPYNATLYEFDAEDIAYCMDGYQYYLSRIKKANEEQKYIGYTDRADNKHGILKANIPLWYRS